MDNITLFEEGEKSEQKRVFFFVCFFKSDYIKNFKKNNNSQLLSCDLCAKGFLA